MGESYPSLLAMNLFFLWHHGLLVAQSGPLVFQDIDTISLYSLPSINVNPREWIKVNIYRGVNN